MIQRRGDADRRETGVAGGRFAMVSGRGSRGGRRCDVGRDAKGWPGIAARGASFYRASVVMNSSIILSRSSLNWGRWSSGCRLEADKGRRVTAGRSRGSGSGCQGYLVIWNICRRVVLGVGPDVRLRMTAGTPGRVEIVRACRRGGIGAAAMGYRGWREVRSVAHGCLEACPTRASASITCDSEQARHLPGLLTYG